jgi:XisI protein
MDQLTKYQEIIKKIMQNHGQYIPSHGKIEPLLICDQNSDNYLLLDTGWDNTGRVHNIVFHLRIKENKIWIEWDGTEKGIYYELLESGVNQDDIILGFLRPEKRKLNEFLAV